MQESTGDMTAEALVALVDAGEPVHVLDVRSPERLAQGRIEIVPTELFHNVRGSEILMSADPSHYGIPRSSPVAVVCGHGNDSQVVAGYLRSLGYDSRSLAGGMVAWMALSTARELPVPPGWDRLVQMDRIGKGALAYVLISRGEALVVDPSRHFEPIVRLLETGGARLVGVADTHAHADYISGGPALAAQFGVPYYLHPADSVYPIGGTPARVSFTAVEDGDEIAVGGNTVSVVHTPGHTEGSVSYRLGADAVLTGDFVFIASVGRPDLGGQAEPWTKALWQSLVRARSEWPGSIVVYPAHYADARERNEDGSVGRAWAELPPGNDPLRIATPEAFTEWVLARVGAFPEAYPRIKAINLGLAHADEEEMDSLEAGQNRCAIG